MITYSRQSRQSVTALVSAKTRWKKNRTDFKVRRKWKVILCQMKAQMIWKQINLSIFLDLPCRLEVVPQKMGHLLTDFWKNSVKKVGHIFFYFSERLTFIITWNNLTFHIWVIWMTELNSINHVFKRLHFDNFKRFEVKSFYIILEDLFHICWTIGYFHFTYRF